MDIFNRHNNGRGTNKIVQEIWTKKNNKTPNKLQYYFPRVMTSKNFLKTFW